MSSLITLIYMVAAAAFILFNGRIAVSVPSVDMLQGPRLIVSADLGSKRKEIEALVARLGSAFTAATGGGEPSTAEVKSVQVTTWPVQFGPSKPKKFTGVSMPPPTVQPPCRCVKT